MRLKVIITGVDGELMNELILSPTDSNPFGSAVRFANDIEHYLSLNYETAESSDDDCPFCIGSGERKGEDCEHCGGTGKKTD